MPDSGLTILDRNVETTDEWLKDPADPTGLSRQQADHVLRAGLHALRARLTVDEAAHLGAQLPHFIRGVSCETWTPARTPTTARTREAVLQSLSDHMAETPLPADRAAEAVFTVLKTHRDPAGLRHVLGVLPDEVGALMDAA